MGRRLLHTFPGQQYEASGRRKSFSDVAALAINGLLGLFWAERARWPLWLPVGLGTGTALYFTLSREPALWLGGSIFCAVLALIMLLRRRPGAMLILLAAGSIVLGFTAAQVRTRLVEAPVIAKRLPPLMVTGRVMRIEARETGTRLWLDALTIPGLTADKTPARIRLRVMSPETLSVGDMIGVRAVLMPPPGPAAPGAFNFARQAWFQQLGAVGFAMGKPHVVRAAEGGFMLAVSRWRAAATERIRHALPGVKGAVAAALMTGERGAIPESDLEAMRDAGLAHLLAISGLHIGLIAGLIFFAVRLGFAALPSVALRYPIKKWAAIAALIGAFAYLLISGATVPTQRAFLMILLVFGAVLVDRTVISMRMVAWAAAVVLLIAPESVTGASFQMSFAAVVGLIAAYEAVGPRLAEWGREARWRLPAAYLAGVVLSTIVATLATAPIAVFHFNQLAMYGLAANLVAVPLTALWIMPWSIVAWLAMPLGLESLPLTAMGWGIDAVIATAHTVAEWPGAVTLVPSVPAAALALFALGGLWLCLWRGNWRYAGLAVAAMGGILGSQSHPPNILVDGSARLLSVRNDAGLSLSSQSVARFEGEMWLRRAGEAEALPWPDRKPTPGLALRCDRLGCIFRDDTQTVALIRDSRALAEDCATATIVVSLVPTRWRCRQPTVVIDRFDIWRNGSHAIWLSANGIRVLSARQAAGERPWVRKPEARRRPKR